MARLGYAALAASAFQLSGVYAFKGVHLNTLAKFSEEVVRKSVELEVGALRPHSRDLRAPPGECNWYLTSSLAAYVTDCTAMTVAIRKLAVTPEGSCNVTYNVNQAYLSENICSNTCYQPMVDTLDKMAKSGCMTDSIMETWCTDCPNGTTCVMGQCLPSCKTNADCKCENTCTSGGCMSKDQAGLSLTKLGVWGLKRGMQELCYTAPDSKNICMGQLYTALGPGVSLENICKRLEGTGCCAATSINFGTKCALSSETVTTDMGEFTVADLENLCPKQDFRTSCATSEAIPKGACVDGYIDGPDGVELPVPGASTHPHKVLCSRFFVRCTRRTPVVLSMELRLTSCCLGRGP